MTDRRCKLDAFAERQRKVQSVTRKQEQMLRINHQTSYDSTDTSSLDSSYTENNDMGHAYIDITLTDQSPLPRLRKRNINLQSTQRVIKKSAKLNTNKSKTVSPAKKIKIQSCVTLTEKQTKNCLQTIKKEKLLVIPSSTLVPSKVNTQPQNDIAKDYTHLERESPKDQRAAPELNYSSKNEAFQLDQVKKDTHYDSSPVRNINTREPCDNLSYASLADLKKGKEDNCFENLTVTYNDVDLRIRATSPEMNAQPAVPAIDCETCDANSFKSQSLSEMYKDTYIESTDLVKNFGNLTENEQDINSGNLAIDTFSLGESNNGTPVKKYAILSETDKQDTYQSSNSSPVKKRPTLSETEKQDTHQSSNSSPVKNPPPLSETYKLDTYQSSNSSPVKKHRTLSEIDKQDTYQSSNSSPVKKHRTLSETDKQDTYQSSNSSPVKKHRTLSEIDKQDTYQSSNSSPVKKHRTLSETDKQDTYQSSNSSPVKKHPTLSETHKQATYYKNLPVDILPSCSTYDKNLGKNSAVTLDIEKGFGSYEMCDDTSGKTYAILPEKEVPNPLNMDDCGSCGTHDETPVEIFTVSPNIDRRSTFPDKLDNDHLDSHETCDDNPVNNFGVLPETVEQNTNPDNLAFDELGSSKILSDNSLNDCAIIPDIGKLDANSNGQAIDDLGSCGIHEDDSSKNSTVRPEKEVSDNSTINQHSIRGTLVTTKEFNTKSEFLCEITGKILTSKYHQEDSVEKEGPSIPLEGKRKRPRPKTSLHKSYTDFMSETEDLSAGSSDLWSANESDSDTGSETKKKIRKRRKKQTLKTKQIAIKERVKMRNESKYRKSRKDAGKSYITKSGSERPDKSMKENPCEPNKCQKKCYEISDTRRKSLFDHFWSLDSQRRRDWIVRCVQTTQVKRKKTKTIDSRRQCSHQYVINEGEGFRPVCQQFLLSTLDITQKFILYNCKNSVDGIAKEDARKGNVPPKYSSEAKEYVKQYIERLPAVPSHYCRENSKRLYLPQEFKNVANLYRMYCLDCNENSKEKVSERIFTSIFKNDYNLSFHVPKKDKCLVCLKAENSEEKTDQDKENFNNHLEEKKSCYKRFKIHQNLKANDTLTVSFDLQKVLNTPYGSSMLLYYSRKYAVYNLTFYESTTQNGQCYIWGEADGKRGANEIASCIYQYLVEIDKRTVIQNVLLYCDSCFGQNKNKVVLTAMHHFLRVSKNIETIQINYLLPGHTYMPVDSMHSIIEKEVKQIIVYSPNEWPTYIQSARKRPTPYQVNVLEYFEFKNWEPLVSNTFTPETLKHMQMSKIRIVTLKKKDLNTMKIKCSMAENAEVTIVPLCMKSCKEVKGKGKGKGRGKKSKEKNEKKEETLSEITLQPLYRNRLPISNAKFKDLIRLCDNGTIPKRFHFEYKNLPHGESTKDTLQSTDDDDDAQDID